MTEDEARTKWCPMVRYAAERIEPGYNRTEDIDKTMQRSACIASDCMMWREEWVKEDEGGGHSLHTIHGYCGLAGRPITP